MKPKILVVDDEPDAIALIEFNLKEAGYDVMTAEDGAEALRKARCDLPDVIVLDLMLPEMDGLEVCRSLRRDPGTAGIPIIILSAKATEIDRVLGLELGADDYITKPFSPRELVLRIRRTLERGQPGPGKSDRIRVGNLLIDIPRHLVTVEERHIDLTVTEFKLLRILAERRGRVQSREQLLKDVWENDLSMDSRTVDTHVRRLRKKLDRAARQIESLRGLGYRLIP